MFSNCASLENTRYCVYTGREQRNAMRQKTIKPMIISAAAYTGCVVTHNKFPTVH